MPHAKHPLREVQALILTAQGRRDDDRRRGTLDNGTRKNWPFQKALRVDLECSCRKLLGLVGASPADRRMRSSKTGSRGAEQSADSPLTLLPIAADTPRRSSCAPHDEHAVRRIVLASRRPCPITFSLHIAVSPRPSYPSKPRLHQLSADTCCIPRRHRRFDFDISSGAPRDRRSIILHRSSSIIREPLCT